ncbi:MAG: HlyC/CorC family transporter [Dehalococcoidia bacterium]|nr:HlyC/CorC family transporter [Dehalococcoidia bacterium]
MTIDMGLAIFLLIVIAAVLAIATAAEAGVITISAARARLMAERGERYGRTLQRQARDRARTYAAFTVLRNAAIISGTALLVFLALDRWGSNWRALIAASLVALVGGLAIQIGPQFIVVQRPGRWAGALTRMADVVRFTLGPVATFFTLPALVLLRMRGVELRAEDEVSEAAELLRAVGVEQQERTIEAEEADMIRGVISLEALTAREVMVPRIDVVAVEADATMREAVDVVVAEGVSRVPVYRGSIDTIVGLLYAKDLLGALASGGEPEPQRLDDLLRPAYFIPEAKRTDDLLREMRLNKVHIAIVVDEYGGTAGIVTIEDMLEEIVGEIEDEFDEPDAPIERVSEDEAIMDARVPIGDLQEMFGVALERDDFDTVGGFVYTQLGTIPNVGDEIRVDGLLVRILSVSGNRINKVNVSRVGAPVPDYGMTAPPPEHS